MEEGWPLGLRPLNARVGVPRRHRDCSGSVSFSNLLSASFSSSTAYSSDLDTQSTGSLFLDKSITLGSLIGVSDNAQERSQRSTKSRTASTDISFKDRKNYCRPKNWCFSMCSKLSTDAVSIADGPSLGHFLEAERRSASLYRRNNQSPVQHGPDDFSQSLSSSDEASNNNKGKKLLFVSGQIAPPQSSSLISLLDGEMRSDGLFSRRGNKQPLCSCSCFFCGEIAH